MASKASKPSPERPSFAKVAAMRPLSGERPSTVVDENTPPTSCTKPSDRSGSPASSREQQSSSSKHVSTTRDQECDGLRKSVQDLHLSRSRDHGGEPEALCEGRDEVPLKADGHFEDDQTHLSNSSTKPTSFDSKSMASVTTFAMDEKESLRPDDSASVQAAEEDDTFSGPASGAPNSRVGSEAGGRLYRISEQVDPSERVPGRLRLHEGGICTNVPGREDTGSNNSMERDIQVFPKEPDEKLLEAMNSPKDRLLLLQLEEKIITFIKDSNDQSLELPPCNAFGRLLGHKLGDYYHLTHFVDNNVTSVRLHRTPFCRLPTPLSELQARNPNKTPPPAIPAMKIMRRVGQPGERPSVGGSTAASSSAPSKATSEVGGEAPGEEDRGGSSSSTPAKERQTLTREEREAKYQEARERIFRDFPESKSSENSNSGEQSANISRSNSQAGRRKGYRQRTPHDDTFEARSQFNAYYPGGPFTNGPVPYNHVAQEGSFMMNQSYYQGQGATVSSANYSRTGPSNAAYHSPGANNNINISHHPLSVPQHFNQNNFPRTHSQQSHPQQPPYPSPYSTNQFSAMGKPPTKPSSAAPPPYSTAGGSQYQQSPQAWNQTPSAHQPSFPSSTDPPPIAYSPQDRGHLFYIQAPMNPYMQNNPQQHLAPGGFGHPPFNPQTLSFTPGGAPQPQLPTNTPQPPMQMHAPSFNAAQVQAHFATNWPGITNSRKYSLAELMGQAQANNFTPPMMSNSIAKWGTPSHLPPKPPPSKVSHGFNATAQTQPSSAQPSYGAATSGHGNWGPLVITGSVDGHPPPPPRF